ncbi:hypothetical protein Q5752_005455 [Cryptotrichosporon argae]
MVSTYDSSLSIHHDINDDSSLPPMSTCLTKLLDLIAPLSENAALPDDVKRPDPSLLAPMTVLNTSWQDFQKKLQDIREQPGDFQERLCNELDYHYAVNKYVNERERKLPIKARHRAYEDSPADIVRGLADAAESARDIVRAARAADALYQGQESDEKRSKTDWVEAQRAEAQLWHKVGALTHSSIRTLRFDDCWRSERGYLTFKLGTKDMDPDFSVKCRVRKPADSAVWLAATTGKLELEYLVADNTGDHASPSIVDSENSKLVSRNALLSGFTRHSRPAGTLPTLIKRYPPKVVVDKMRARAASNYGSKGGTFSVRDLIVSESDGPNSLQDASVVLQYHPSIEREGEPPIENDSAMNVMEDLGALQIA